MRSGFLAGAAFILGVVAGVFLAPLIHKEPPAAPAQPVVQTTTPARVEKSGDPFESAKRKGDAAMDAGRCEDAIAAYESALSMRFDADAATDRGVCLRQLGRKEQAMAAFEFVTLREPKHWKARYNLTAMLIEAGRKDEAMKSFSLLEKLGAEDEAVQALRKALQVH